MAVPKKEVDTTPVTKKFGKGERSIPHSSLKARKFYPAEDESAKKTVRERGELVMLSFAVRNGKSVRRGAPAISSIGSEFMY